jgi:hypothetical protein
MAPAAEGDGVVAAVRRRAEALASMRPSAAAAAAAASLGHGPREPRLPPTSTDVERSTPDIVGGGRVERAASQPQPGWRQGAGAAELGIVAASACATRVIEGGWSGFFLGLFWNGVFPKEKLRNQQSIGMGTVQPFGLQDSCVGMV